MGVSWEVEQDFVLFFSLLGVVLVSIPLYWHLEAWNVGCIMFIFWTGSQCLIQFINMSIWKDNAINWAPVWCDITTRWMLATSVGVCASSLVINRRLYKVATISSLGFTREEKRRMILIDFAIALGLPILQVGVYWFIQGHRFDILEGYGCIYAIPNTILSYFLFDSWPILIGLVSASYAIMTLRAFLKRRKQLNELMAGNSNLNFNRYFRLMGLASTELCCSLPASIFALVTNSQQPIYKFVGLADLHYDFSRVVQYPAIYWRSSPNNVRSIDFDLWTNIALALLFFALFGLAEEARKHYSLALAAIARTLRIPPSFMESLKSRTLFSRSSSSKLALPVVTIRSFLQRPPKRDSIASFSTRPSTSEFTLDNLPPFGHELDAKLAPDALTADADDDKYTRPRAVPEKGKWRASKTLPALPSPTRDSFVLDIPAKALRGNPDVPLTVHRDSFDSDMV